MLRLVFLFCATLLLWLGAASAHARTNAIEVAPKCHLFTGDSATLDGALKSPSNWDCSAEGWDSRLPIAWLSFDMRGFTKTEPAFDFRAHMAKLRSVTLTAIDADGERRSIVHQPEDLSYTETGPFYTVTLPEIRDDTVQLIARIDRAHNILSLSGSRVSSDETMQVWSTGSVALTALVMGLLIVALVLDLAAYMILRQRFALMHACIIVGMLGFLAVSSGLVSLVSDARTDRLWVFGTLCCVFSVASSSVFARDLIEKGMLPLQLRKALLVSAVWSFTVSGFFGLQLHATHAFDNSAYFISFLPVIAIYAISVFQALIRGSIAARYLAFGWAAVILAVVERIARGMGLYVGPSELDQLLHLAVGIEVLIVALGVGHRFLQIKRERDQALQAADVMEQLVLQDPLTGVMNRRGLEPEFDHLLEQGFTIWALIDLDNFKSVNDEFGHQIGDEVLKATALALCPDENTLVVRIGGEEFILLLRGANAVERAERRRRAITNRVMTAVPVLDRPVTASMGIVDIENVAKEVNIDFTIVYSRVDQLLYRAKEQGRNCYTHERLSLFDPEPAGEAGAMELGYDYRPAANLRG
ncbi:GGDEF domain-containing protein [Qipengyuania marisflavi]|uniref:diguanylate cyclase n=1 Tax=Qipengyuania marisflavi TaxID=2486356 RepID=A0A5S3PXR3_9SPHN|nr:diguanylate cyclase [Qipengyuania marisflavi]TMM48385.1 diguanylate cyclase [Qipengyuania marisflavi]